MFNVICIVAFIYLGMEIFDFVGLVEVFINVGWEVFIVVWDKSLVISQGIVKILLQYDIMDCLLIDIFVIFGGNLEEVV